MSIWFWLNKDKPEVLDKYEELKTALKHQSKEMEECIKLLNDFSIGREVIVERLKGAMGKVEKLISD